MKKKGHIITVAGDLPVLYSGRYPGEYQVVRCIFGDKKYPHVRKHLYWGLPPDHYKLIIDVQYEQEGIRGFIAKEYIEEPHKEKTLWRNL